MRKIELDERRARLGRRHWLARPAADPVQVAGDLVGLHSSDPATVFLSVRARLSDFSIGDLERAMYTDRSLIRMHAMRRTIFVIPISAAPVLDSAVTQKIEVREKKRLAKMLEEQGLVKNGSRWLDRVIRDITREVGERGEATTTELAAAVPGLRDKYLRFGDGTKWVGQVAVATRVMFLAAMTGGVARGRPAGSWISSQYAWLPGLPITGERPNDAAARAKLIRMWLRTYGPGTLTDLKWWSSLTVTHVRQALSDIEAEEVALAEGTGFVLPGDEENVEPKPWVAFLPGLDQAVMGWKEREWFLGDHQGELFDRNGNAGPTVWADGRIIGGYGQTEGGAIRFKLLEKVDSTTSAKVEEAAADLEEWLDGTRVRPRFPVPLSKKLS